ncbi:MAG: DUF5683 domain-containing protein [Bacteroidota bacterium]
MSSPNVLLCFCLFIVVCGYTQVTQDSLSLSQKIDTLRTDVSPSDLIPEQTTIDILKQRQSIDSLGTTLKDTVALEERMGEDMLRLSKSTDTLRTELKSNGITVDEVIYTSEPINPLSPSKAAFYSAVFPGLGQIYNKRYWKVPLVWGALGFGAYSFADNNSRYIRVRDAFKRRRAGFIDDEFYDTSGVIVPGSPRVSDSGLENAQENLQRTRDLWLVVTIGLYALNIIDANVDAHLKQYNVDERLTYQIKPFLDQNAITGLPEYGFTFILEF